MKTFQEYVNIYHEQLKKGDIQEAYTGLVKYVMKLSTILSKKLPDFTCGNLFQGYMDYTYFYFSNDFLRKRKLRFGLVLNHPDMRFEIWLLGQNLKIQDQYWQLLKSTKWNGNRTERPQYSIIEVILVDHPNFDDLDALSNQIEKALTKISNNLIDDIQKVDLT